MNVNPKLNLAYFNMNTEIENMQRQLKSPDAKYHTEFFTCLEHL